MDKDVFQNQDDHIEESAKVDKRAEEESCFLNLVSSSAPAQNTASISWQQLISQNLVWRKHSTKARDSPSTLATTQIVLPWSQWGKLETPGSQQSKH